MERQLGYRLIIQTSVRQRGERGQQPLSNCGRGEREGGKVGFHSYSTECMQHRSDWCMQIRQDDHITIQGRGKPGRMKEGLNYTVAVCECVGRSRYLDARESMCVRGVLS